MNDALHKFPRLYVDAPLNGSALPLAENHAHYLKNVLRMADGDIVRLFNGQDGEWIAKLDVVGKRDVVAHLAEQVKKQAVRTRRVHLLFAPIKKDRLDTLIEAAVQLDATDLHPILTDRTEVREVKEEKLKAQIIEAAEQSERLDLPTLHPLMAMDKALAAIGVPVFAGLERSDAKILNDALVPEGDCAALVGPVGGWTERERDAFNETPGVIAVSLGSNVLRCEIAVAAMLSSLRPSGR